VKEVKPAAEIVHEIMNGTERVILERLTNMLELAGGLSLGNGGILHEVQNQERSRIPPESI
jgi:hypothetical protein